MPEKKKLKIKIFDKEYSLLVEDDNIVKELASYVDEVIKQTSKELPDQTNLTVSIIASLNIAYDLFLEKNRNREFLIQSSDKIKRIKLLLDQHQISEPS